MSSMLRMRQLIEAAKKNQAELIAAKTLAKMSDDEKKELASDTTKKLQDDFNQAVKGIDEVIANTAVSIEADEQVVNSWEWHENQLQAIKLAEKGESFCLIGAAGTGKTTTVKEIVKRLMISGHIGTLQEDTKFIKKGSPSIVFCAYTRRATNNLRKHLPKHLQDNCLTFHKLLEFEPMELSDSEGKLKMRFLPKRNSLFKLPHIDFIVMEEGSMTGIDLYNLVIEATDGTAKEIHIGDINQLKPVFGDAILGYKLNQIPVVELTRVYRQALESPIISFAHKILEGKPLNESDITTIASEPYLNFLPYKKNLDGNIALRAVKAKFTDMIKNGTYDFDSSIILCPFNKSFGCIELNRSIAQAHGEVREAVVHEIVAGFETFYYAEGDRVLYKKDAGIIIDIKQNLGYSGKRFRQPSMYMNRWGVTQQPTEYIDTGENQIEFEDFMEGIIDNGDISQSDEERKFQASHTLIISLDSGETVKVTSASSYNNDLEYGYCMTVHKAQGSQWEHVYLVLHRDHNVMVNRELLYTAVTRAEKYLTIIYSAESRINLKDGTFGGGIKRQAVKGKTLQDKIRYFSGKMDKLNTNKAVSLIDNVNKDEFYDDEFNF